MFNAIFLMILGASIIALGVFAIKKPASGMWRSVGWNKDRDPSEDFMAYIKLAGSLAVFLGALLFLGGILAL